MEILKNLESKNYGILGSHPEIIEIHKIIGRLSKNRLPVLVEGEPGTGKHQVAKILHLACCPDKEFVTIDCTTLVPMLLKKEFFGTDRTIDSDMEMNTQKGKFVYAADGIILLDEVSALPLSFQWIFLKAIQQNEFSSLAGEHFGSSKARIVATTQYNLRDLVKKRAFREDLYYYLASSKLALPPLRERRTDIPLIVSSMLKKLCMEHNITTASITQRAMSVLIAHDWPGNLEELEDTLLRALKSANGKILSEKSLALLLNSSDRYIWGHS